MNDPAPSPVQGAVTIRPAPWTGIAWCPCCCSPVDAEGEPGQTVSLTCTVCDQHFMLDLDPARFAEHALS